MREIINSEFIRNLVKQTKPRVEKVIGLEDKRLDKIDRLKEQEDAGATGSRDN